MTRKDYIMLSDAAGEYFALGRPHAEAAGAAQLMVLILLRIKADNKSFSIAQFIQNTALASGGEEKLEQIMAAAGTDIAAIEEIEKTF